MPLRPSRVFAVDWSGDNRNARRKIWLAEASNGRLLRLENGRNSDEVAEFFLLEAKRDLNFVVGFDFAFSFPLAYCESLNARTVNEVWRAVSKHGETWLTECLPPFWGKAGRRKPRSGEAFRSTELAITDDGSANPKSIFQIGGAGAVGTGSLRGMAILAKLHDTGFSIWPFDHPVLPLIVEIYPRLLTGRVNKSSKSHREAFLEKWTASMSPELIAAACSNEDAFDAAVSALVMSQRTVEFGKLEQGIERWELMEGKIWSQT
jgi:hypothetical protein